MSFFGKVKQFFGAGTVKVELSIPARVEKTAGRFPGRVLLDASSDQHILELTVALVETWSTGRGDDRQEREFELGKIKIAETFDMKQHDKSAFDFVLPFEMLKSENDRLKEAGGAIGMLGKAAAFASAERSAYRVVAEADVKGAAFDPSDKKEILLV
jgi:hypothetical protein